MERYVQIFVVLATTVVFTQCDIKTNCFKPVKSELTFVCPLNYYEDGGFEITITPAKEVIIQCAHLDTFNVHQLPKIKLRKINLLKFESCPLPDNGYQEVLKWFAVKDVVVVEHEFGRFNIKNFTKDVFQNLQFLRYLKLGSNKFNTLNEDTFANTPNLFALELRNNNLTELSPQLFEKLLSLEWLDLADNEIEIIPLGLFHSLKNLEYLHLWGNKITVLDDNTFKQLSNLKYLDLSANPIKTISENVFRDLRNVVNLNLAANHLHFISQNVFRYCTKLESLILRNSNNLELGEYLFSNFTSLQEVDLSNCNLRKITGHIFENSHEMRIVNLQSNNLTEIPKTLFRDLFDLQKIDLAQNKIRYIDNTFTSLKKLKVLSLQNNAIENITQSTFSDLIYLEELNLAQNQIKYIHPMAFYNNDRLRIINLSRNLYSGDDTILKDLVYLEVVDFSYNFINQIEQLITLDNKPMLETLNLSGNVITHVTLDSLDGPAEVDINLEFNNISLVSFKNIDLGEGTNPSIIHLGNNPLQCDCNNYDLVKYFNGEVSENVILKFNIRKENLTCATPVAVRNKHVKNLKLSNLICPLNNLIGETGCPKVCQCKWRPFDTSVIVDCANRNLTVFPKIVPTSFKWITFTDIEVNLRNNSLLSINLTECDEITRLYLSHNKIQAISGIPRRLKVLELDHNHLSALSSDVLRTLNTSYLENVTLQHNPWICTCGSEILTNFIRQHAKAMDFKNVYCSNTTIPLINLNIHDLCEDVTLICTIIVISLLLLPLASAAFYYKFQQPIKIWLYSKNLCLCWVSEEDLDQNKIFDAFICYSCKDEDFVVETLIPQLENSPQGYKLCFHLRNWTPGELISSNIIRSIRESKRTIILLSKHFLESNWGLAEFKEAHADAMAAGRARVIIIIYGDVDAASIKDEQLKAYLQTSTYLKWGDPYFWRKLRYALPHRTK